MLKAILFNAATHVPGEVSDLWTLRYLRWIDELEPQHIAVLRYSLLLDRAMQGCSLMIERSVQGYGLATAI